MGSKGNDPAPARRRPGPLKRLLLAAASVACVAGAASAREIHLDCSRTGQTVMVDVDTDRRFMQLMWSEGVAEEYKDGDSYISGPDSFGEKEKVVYILGVDNDIVTFGQDRLCLQDGSKRKCVDKHVRNTLDALRGEMKYDDGEMIAVLKCVPAPPGRGF